MIYFASSRQSYDQLSSSSAWPPSALWTAPGVLNHGEMQSLRAAGISVTNFTSDVSLIDALDVIREHHPDQEIVVDGRPAG